MPDNDSVQIFIASSGELLEERRECVLLINQLNDAHPHLHLKPFEWEYSIVHGNFPDHESIQDGINPDLKESKVAVFIFYSRLGVNTRKEFNLAQQDGKQLFILFKDGFTTKKKEELVLYCELLEFRESLNNTVLQLEYSNLAKFRDRLYSNLNLYLSQKHSRNSVSTSDNKLSESVIILVQQLAAKDERIKQLEENNKVLPVLDNQQEIQQLIKDKEDLQQQLLQNKEIQAQQATDKAALEQQLSVYKEPDSLKAKALEEVQKKNYAGAEQYLKESAKQSIHDAANTFYELGKIKKLQLEYKEAYDYFELAAKINPESSLYLHNAGSIADDLGLYDIAFNYIKKALIICKEKFGEESLEVAIAYNNLGVNYIRKGEYNKAIDHLNKALDISKKHLGGEHANTATGYNNLGLAYRKKGEYDKAIQYFKQALTIDRKYYGEEHANTAIQYFKQALTIDRKYYGEEHANTAMWYNNLGSAYCGKGEYDKAIQYFEQALTIDRKYHGESHPDIATSYNNLGSAYNNKGEYDQAIQYFEQALLIDRKYYGESHPDIATDYNNLSAPYCSKGKYDEAIKFYNQSLTMYQKFFPHNHFYIQKTQRNLELAQQAKGQQ